MRINIYSAIVLCITLLPNIFYGQSTSIGIAQSNYNIVESVSLNPANSGDPKVYFDLHILGGENSTSSNYLKFNAREYGIFNGQIPDSYSLDPKKNDLNLTTENKIFGPGFNYSIDRYTVGINTATREFVNIENFKQELMEDYEFGQTGNTVVITDQAKADFFRWEEIGIHGAAILYKKKFDMIIGGINLKYLNLLAIHSVRFDNLEMQANAQQAIQFNSLDGTISNSSSSSGLGFGYSIDLGFQYKKMQEGVTHYLPHSFRHNCKSIDYKYKIGFSLLDIGQLFYNDNVQQNTYNLSDIGLPSYRGLESNDSKNYAEDLNGALGSSQQSSADQVRALPPTALSLQYDYNLTNNYYFNLSGLYGMNRTNNLGAERISWLAASYRYETPKLEVSATASYNNLNDPGIGMAFRIWMVSFGTQNLIPYITGDSYNASAYFHLRFSIKSSNKCVTETADSDWRVNDCSGPKSYDMKGRKFKKSKAVKKRNRKQKKKYN